MTAAPSNTRRPCRSRLFFLGLFALLLAAKLALIAHFGNATPFWDQWTGLAKPLFIPALEHRLNAGLLFETANEHRIVLTRLLTLGLLKLNGLWDPKLEMVAQAFLHSACIVFLIALCARHLSSPRARLLFTAFALALFLIPFGWENTLWGLQSLFYFVLLWGVLGIACCWQHPTLSPRWWLGVFFFGLGLISIAGGLLAPAAAAVLMALRAIQDRPNRARHLGGFVVLAALVVAGFLLAGHAPHHDVLKARDLAHFTTTLLKVAAWPVKIATFAPLFQAPLLLLVLWALRTRRAASDPAWLLITLGLWGAAQSAAIAYARAEGFGASRYADHFTVTLAIGFACLLYLRASVSDRFRRPVLILGLVWIAVVGGCIIEASAVRLPERIQRKHAESLIQEANVRAYLATGDITVLQNKPRLHVPYPDVTELASLLDHPTLRAVLPTELEPDYPSPNPSASLALTPKKEIGPASLVSNFLQAQAAWIALLGLMFLSLGARTYFSARKIDP